MNSGEKNAPEGADMALGVAGSIVAAMAAAGHVTAENVVAVLESVHDSSMRCLTGTALLGTFPAQAEELVPPVSIRKSITDDYLVSMEDGRRYKSLKRHLSGRGLTPEAYRKKWSLPVDYPMVAPSYARQRSELAKAMGLGRAKRAPAAKGRAR